MSSGEPLTAPSQPKAGPSHLSTLEGPLEKGRGKRRGRGAGRGETLSHFSSPAVVICSTGPAAAGLYSGWCLGEFLAVEGEERERCPVYRQRHTVTSEEPFYLYR